MASRMKEDERIERAIRSLLKLHENRRCINCNCLGPQYVCTTFLTFVCTNCSGIHREFTHRVKSVSMAKFTAEEVGALQEGGNERARKIYFKKWDPQRNAYPDGSNLHRLRDFIKHVYVDKKYTGESNDKLPTLRLNDRDETYGSKKIINAYSLRSRSPHYEDKSEWSNNERVVNTGRERRSPHSAQESSRSGSSRKTTLRFEVVDDRFRDDGNGRRYEGLKFGNRDSKVAKSNDPKKKMERSNSAVLSPVTDILGDNPPHLQVGKVQKATSSSDLQTVDANPVEQIRGNLESLIDFTDSEPSDTATASKAEQTSPSNNGGNESLCEVSAKEKSPQVPCANSLESLLFELSSPFVGAEGNKSETPSDNDSSLTASGGRTPGVVHNDDGVFTSSITNVQIQSTNGGSPHSAHVITGESAMKLPGTPQFHSTQQHQLSSLSAVDSTSNTQQTTSSAMVLSNKPWTLSTAPNTQGPSSASVEQSSKDVPGLAQDAMPGVGSQCNQMETESSGRKELPADLFTASYSEANLQVPSWQSGPHHGMGFGMQYYPNPVVMGRVPCSVKSTNPFDLNGDRNPTQASPFPSMESLLGATPNVSAPTGLYHSSSSGSSTSGLIASQSPFASGMTPDAYIQQVNMSPSRLQGVGGFGIDGDAFGTSKVVSPPPSGYPAAMNNNYFHSRGGNPFG